MALKKLSDYRTKNKSLKANVYDILIKVFKKISDFFLENCDNKTENILVLLLSTFYLEGKENNALSEDLKKHELFAYETVWEKLRSYNLDLKKELLYSYIDREIVLKGELSEYNLNLAYITLTAAFGPFITGSFGISKEIIKKIITKLIDEFPNKDKELILKDVAEQFEKLNDKK